MNTWVRLLMQSVCVVVVVLLVGSVAWADLVTLTPIKDNSLYEDNPDGSNGAGPDLFSGTTLIPSPRRALLAFDIAGNVPAGATITSATLTLDVNRDGPLGQPATFTLHRVLADWGEGTSVAPGPGGFGGPATPGDATWLDRMFPDTPWATPGGDFVPGASSSALIDGLGLVSFGGLAGDVQAMLADPSANHGWILIGEEAASGGARRFSSRESADPNVVPELSISFFTNGGGEPVPTTSEWGLIVMALLIVGAAGWLLRRG